MSAVFNTQRESGKKELVWHFFLTRLLIYNDKIFRNNKTTHLNIIHIANSKATFRIRNYIQIAHVPLDPHYLWLDFVDVEFFKYELKILCVFKKEKNKQCCGSGSGIRDWVPF